MADERIYLHGCAYLSDRDTNGRGTNFVDYGETSALELSLSQETIIARSTCDAIAVNARKATASVTITGTLTLKSRSKEALAAAIFGTITDITSGTTSNFSNVAFPSGIVAGETRQLPNGLVGVNSLSITDSAGSPTTLTAGTDYEVISLDHGLIKFLTVSGKTQPFKASGVQKAGVQAVDFATKKTVEKWLLFKGINVMENDRAETVELYKISLDVASSIQLKGSGTEDTSFEIPFTALKDEAKPYAGAFGNYGRWIKVG